MIAATWFVAACGDDDNDNDNNNNGVTTFRVTLTPDQVVPVCARASTNATGVVDVSVADDDSFIRVNQLTFTGLSSDATTAFIEQGQTGVNGPEVLAVDVNLVPFSTVTFDASDFPSPAPAGASPDFQSFAEAMRAGDTNITIATVDCPDGEIRAQIQ
ncbi:MAG: CHRD domain-containing protein [Kofleriaceae bacterium]|nr:CHRD domain-containing protein [Kofleriaceae bacterium]